MTFEGYVRVRLVSPSRKERVSISRASCKEDRECKGQMQQLMKGLKSPIFGDRKKEGNVGQNISCLLCEALGITRTVNLRRS